MLLLFLAEVVTCYYAVVLNSECITCHHGNCGFEPVSIIE